MSREIDDLPMYIGSLPGGAATRHLTRSVLGGDEDPPLVALVRASDARQPASHSARWDTRVVRDLIEEARRRYATGARTGADAWLAPRLHAALRLTRAEAADPAIWNFLALIVAPDYVVWRHLSTPSDGRAPAVNATRFSGPHYSQAFARLWWAAEIFRDGEDYRPVVAACRIQDVLNTTLRLEIVDHRPTARAIVHLIENGTVRTGRDVNGLSTAVNTAGSTLMYDVIAPDVEQDVDAYRHWMDEIDSAPPVPRDFLPDGPDDGAIPRGSVDVMAELLRSLFLEAPVRGKGEPRGDWTGVGNQSD